MRLALVGLARVLLAVVMVVALGWTLTELAPGTAAERAARVAGALPADESRLPPGTRAAILAEVAARHELDGPAAIRIAHRSLAIVTGDLGLSWRDGAPVSAQLARAAPATAAVIALALVWAMALGLAAALVAATRARRWPDRLVGAAVAAALSVSPVWLAIVCAERVGDAVVIAAAVLGLVPAAVIARHGRAALRAELGAPWAAAARARGNGPWRLTARWAVRPAVASLAPLVPVAVSYLVGAVVIVERVFGIRGLGALALDAAARGDAPVVVAVAAGSGAAIAIAALLGDGLARWADPRLRGERA